MKDNIFQILRLSQWWWFKSRSSGLWRHGITTQKTRLETRYFVNTRTTTHHNKHSWENWTRRRDM